MSGECEKCHEHCLDCQCASDPIKEKILAWKLKYGKLSPVFLQCRLKISFNEAKKLFEDFYKNDNHKIETCQNEQKTIDYLRPHSKT